MRISSAFSALDFRQPGILIPGGETIPADVRLHQASLARSKLLTRRFELLARHGSYLEAEACLTPLSL